jgi:HD-like signal output (HDOD) protein
MLRERIEGGTLELPVLPEVAAEVLASTSREECDLRALAHARVGSSLIAKWSLPASLATTILRHHTPGDATADKRGPMMTALADELAHQTLDAEPRDEALLRTHGALDVLNLYPEDVDKLLALRSRVVDMVTAIA